MPQEGRRKMVVVEEGTLAGMAANAAFTAEFPFLAPLANMGRNPGCCGKAAQERSKVFGAAKVALAGMSAEKKRRLKELLNANNVRVTYRTPTNRVVALTF